MLGKFLTSAINSNPIIVEDISKMPLYLEEKYLGLFVKYIGKTSGAYTKGYVYKVIEKDGTYAFLPYFGLETLSNGAKSENILVDYSAYNDKGEKIDGSFKIAPKTIVQNGTYVPSADNVNAYSSITVQVEGGETGTGPFVATSDREMDSYLTEEYDGAFVRMEYSKYRPTSFPISCSVESSKLNLTISKRRMRNFIDSWTFIENNRYILDITRSSSEYKVLYRFRAYRNENADGTIFRLLYIEERTTIIVGGTEYSGDVYNYPVWVENYKSAQTILPELAQDSEALSFDGDEGKEYINGWTLVAMNYNVVTGITSASISQSSSNALVILNAIANDSTNKYNEGEVYKVVFDRNVTKSTYQAESPFEVGDTFAGATMYFNTELTADDFMETIVKPIYDGYSESTMVFFNMDNPPDMDNIDVNSVGPLLGLVLVEGQLLSYSMITEEGNLELIAESGTDTFVVNSLKIPESLTIEDISVTIPETITQIYRSDILNQFVGKTATFTKTETTTYATYKFEKQISDGDVAEMQLVDKLTAQATDSNIGNIYRYVGEDSDDFENGEIYLVAEVL